MFFVLKGPHRERLGYGGDALMTAESFIHNFDMAAFYSKRILDYADAQRANGGFTETAPFVGIDDAGMGGDSGPIGWQSFMPIAQVRCRLAGFSMSEMIHIPSFNYTPP